jgi:hypothetical protein
MGLNTVGQCGRKEPFPVVSQPSLLKAPSTVASLSSEADDLNSNSIDQWVCQEPAMAPIDPGVCPLGQVQLSSTGGDQQQERVVSISTGNFHTVVLTAEGEVFTFGSNASGQLGVGDTMKRSGVSQVKLPEDIRVVQAVAGEW